MIKVIFKSVYGSHLYGTSTPTSDLDFKQIHMNPTDMMLTGKDSGCFNKNTNNSGRNTKDDVDFESKELRTFIQDCLSGQTYALDLLFTPPEHWVEISPMWEEILSLRDKLITRNVKPFIGYVQSQAAKYSEKGKKYNELKKFIGILEKTNPTYTFKDFNDKCNGLENIETSLFAKIVENVRGRFKKNTYENIKINFSEYKHFKYYVKVLGKAFEPGVHNFTSEEMYLDGPDCSFPASRKIKDILPVLRVKFETFGKRVEEAAKNEGLDLKAYYHALRIVWQLEEYLTTRKLTFPSARVQDLRDVRAGKYNREQIETWIATEIERVLTIPNELPEADNKFWNEWLLNKYMIQAYEQSREYLLHSEDYLIVNNNEHCVNCEDSSM